MSLFKKIQEKIIPVSTSESAVILSTPPNIKHEFVNFQSAYRIGILSNYTDSFSQEIISNYKKQIEKFGYECEVLLFVDKKEKDHNVFLQYYNWEDLDRKSMLPYSPKTDRFIFKKYDLLLNLYLQPIPSLLHISKMSHAKCRVGSYVESMKDSLDLLIPKKEGGNIEQLIKDINEILIFKKYERQDV